MLTKLTEAECRAAIKDGEFPKEIIGAAPVVVLALTQSWCSQWIRMQPWLDELSAEGLYCRYVEYDREPFFDDFRRFKESVFRNDEVPYYRYYRDGKLFKESNYLDKLSFRNIIFPKA
jgi:hypothetical protein